MLVDGHEDLALNVVSYGRDYLGSTALEIRAREDDAPPGGRCMVSLADWQAGGIGVVVATIAVIPADHGFPGEQSYVTAEEARAAALAQLAVYEEWDASGAPVSIVRERRDLDRDGVRLVLLMENADPIRDVADLAFWVERGVRIVGPAWHANRYAGDTRQPGPLTPLGRELVRELGRIGVALDVTHLAEEATLEAFGLSDGPVTATHAHSRRTVALDRLLGDGVVAEIAARDGVVGLLPVNWALAGAWRRGDARPPLDRVVDAVEDLLALVDVSHIGVGTDYDGGQGAESAPAEIETIADLPKLGDALVARGYARADADAILGRNWLRWLRAVL
ncbi:MAG TPA: membrane dipeptidase [Gaiellaceae bacterium]